MGATKIDMKPWDDLLDAAGVLVHHADGPAVIEKRGVWFLRSGKLEKLARCVDALCESEECPNGALNTLRAKMKRRMPEPEATRGAPKSEIANAAREAEDVKRAGSGQ